MIKIAFCIEISHVLQLYIHKWISFVVFVPKWRHNLLVIYQNNIIGEEKWSVLAKLIGKYFKLDGKIQRAATDIKQCTNVLQCTEHRRRVWTLNTAKIPTIDIHNSIVMNTRFPLPEMMAQVDGWSVSITRQHGPCWRAINSGSGNQALLSSAWTTVMK